MNWNNLSLKQKADIIKLSVQSGITDLSVIQQLYNSSQQDKQDTDLSYTAGSIVDNLHKAAIEERSLGTPSHNYDFTQSEEWANAHGYYPDSRGHRDDRVKKLSHPTHPSRGTWNSDREFQLTNLGFEDPNYTIFGMADGNQDPQAILSYKGNIVLPELTVTPKGNYYNNSYDNVQIKLSKGGQVQRKNKFEDGGTIEPVDYETPWGITTRNRYRGQYIAPTSAIYFKSKQDRDTYAAQQDMSLYGNVLPELSITANKDNTTSTNMGSYSSNTQRRSPNRTYADRFYNMSDWDSLFGPDRVNINKKAWQENPEYMQNWTNSGNIAAGFTVAPFAAAAIGEYALPWLTNTGLPAVGNSAKQILQNSTPSALTRGLSYYFPQYTSTLNTAGLWGDAAMYSYFAKDALGRLTNKDGVNKTINLYSNGDIWGGTKSLAGDIFDASLTMPFTQGFYNYGKGLIDPIARQTAFIRQIHPFGYQGHWKDGLKFFKDWMLYPINQYPAIPQYEFDLYEVPLYLMNLRTRQEAIRLSLGFPPSRNSQYILNPDGKTYSYNYRNVIESVPPQIQHKVSGAIQSNVNYYLKEQEPFVDIYPPIRPGEVRVKRDPITGAGGNVKLTGTPEGGFIIDDVWDLQPFQNTKWLPQRIRNFEVINFLGGKPLVLRHKVPKGFDISTELINTDSKPLEII